MLEKENTDVHIGVDCQIKFFVEVKGSSLRDAARQVEEETDFSSIEEIIPVEELPSIVSNVEELRIFREEKEDPIVIFTNEQISEKAKLFGVEVSTLISYISGAFIGFWIISFLMTDLFSQTVQNIVFISGIIWLIGHPLCAFIFAKLLIDNKISIPNWFIRWPENNQEIGTYLFEISGLGFVQMFIDAESESSATEKAKYVLDLESKYDGKDVTLSYFASIQELQGIYLCHGETHKRISSNLVSYLRRRYLYSYRKFVIYGYSSVLLKWAIPLAIVLCVIYYFFL